MWSQMNVVSNEKVSCECGVKWTGLQCRGLKWTWSHLSVHRTLIIKQRSCFDILLLSTGSLCPALELLLSSLCDPRTKMFIDPWPRGSMSRESTTRLVRNMCLSFDVGKSACDKFETQTKLSFQIVLKSASGGATLGHTQKTIVTIVGDDGKKRTVCVWVCVSSLRVWRGYERTANSCLTTSRPSRKRLSSGRVNSWKFGMSESTR